MPKIAPRDERLRKHIDYYWIVDEDDPLSGATETLSALPSLAFELVMGIKGCIRCSYKGTQYSVTDASLFGYIDSPIRVDTFSLIKCIIVKFRNRGIFDVLPFTLHKASEISGQQTIRASEIFGSSFTQFEKHLVDRPYSDVADELDDWFASRLEIRSGIVCDVLPSIGPSTSVKDLVSYSGSSPRTLSRHFYSDVAMSPKQFLRRNRFRLLVEDLVQTDSPDWFDLVLRYDYHDQSHLINEVKRYSGLSPRQLLSTPLFLRYRPAS